jgi:microcystin-dependent protein
MAKLLNLLKLRSFSTAADSAVEVAITSDTQPRLRVDAGGKHTWGAGGTTAGDTTLYRSAADTLKTDDAFIAAGGLTVKTIEIDPASASSGQVLQYNGTKFVPVTASTVGSIDDLSDVVVSSPLQFQGLMYDGTNWVNSNIPNTYLVRNNTGSTLLKGTLVGAVGAEPSGRIDVAPFEVTGGQDSELRAMGIVVSNISNGVNGEVISFGTLTGLDTRGSTESPLAVGDETWAAGDILFAHPTVDGKLTKVRPQHDLAVAFITVRHASSGQIAIRIIPGNNHLEWMHDVSLSSPTAGQVLTYNGTLWANASASGGATVSDNVPSSPTAGQVWFESDTGKTFVYYDSYWVEISGGRGDSNPVGAVTAFAGATAPTGWLLCAGQTVSRTVYASLFTVVGTTYNIGGEAGTDFRLPDLRGRTVAGIDNMGGTDAGRLDIANSSGTVVGSQYVTLSEAQIPSHTHIQNAHTHTQNAHGHFLGPGQSFGMSGTNFGGGNNGGVATFAVNVQFINQGTYQGGYLATDSTATNQNTTATNQNTGGGGAHNNMQPTMVLNYIIKAL